MTLLPVSLEQLRAELDEIRQDYAKNRISREEYISLVDTWWEVMRKHGLTRKPRLIKAHYRT